LKKRKNALYCFLLIQLNILALDVIVNLHVQRYFFSGVANYPLGSQNSCRQIPVKMFRIVTVNPWLKDSLCDSFAMHL